MEMVESIAVIDYTNPTDSYRLLIGGSIVEDEEEREDNST